MSTDYWTGALPEVERVVLDRVQEQVAVLVSDYAIHLARDGVGVDHLAGDIAAHLVYTLRYQALRHRCEPFEASVRASTSLVVPATWWQHWKADHAGSRLFGWVRRWWPVRTTTVTAYPMVTAAFDKAALFPQPAVDYPDELGPVVLNITPSLRQRMTVTHEHDEYDPARLRREFRDYQRAFDGLLSDVLTFDQWRARRDERIRRQRERERAEHDRYR